MAFIVSFTVLINYCYTWSTSFIHEYTQYFKSLFLSMLLHVCHLPFNRTAKSNLTFSFLVFFRASTLLHASMFVQSTLSSHLPLEVLGFYSLIASALARQMYVHRRAFLLVSISSPTRWWSFTKKEGRLGFKPRTSGAAIQRQDH